VGIHLNNSAYPDERLRRSIFRILETVTLCSLATAGLDAVAHINTAYYCYTDGIEIYFVSDPGTKHCHNIAIQPRIAVAIFDTNQPWGDALRGLQMFGECHLASAQESIAAFRAHASRFLAYGDYIQALSPFERDSSPHKFYVFLPASVKILDESAFGEETFVTAEIVRD